MSDEPVRPSAASILGAARAALLSPTKKLAPRRRLYPAMEALAGAALAPYAEAPILAFRGAPITKATALVKADITKRAIAKPEQLAARMTKTTKGLTAHQKFQQLIERTVKALMMTASERGDLAFRADINANVMSDLSVDVMLSPHGLEIAFYTEDTNTRRLLQGYERDLIAHLSSKGLKVLRIRYETEPNPHDPPPVPVG